MTPARFELVINTRDGTFIRSVPESTQLPEADTHGHAAEDAVVNAMSSWGLPDFAFRSSTVAVSSGTREVGDGLILTYPLAAVIQVKARQSVSDNPSRERSWLKKHIGKANRQIGGTLGSLRSRTISKNNVRGTSIPIVAAEHEWVAIVIVEHDDIPHDFTPIPLTQRGVVLTRADWEFLWEQLQSTVEVLRYIHRVGTSPPIPLGEESSRYYYVAQLDDEAEPVQLPTAWASLGGTRLNGPLLSRPPAGQVVDHYVIRQIMEDLARQELPDGVDPKRVLRALSALDGINVPHRDQLGSDLMQNLAVVSEAPEHSLKLSKRALSPLPNIPQLVFMTYNSHEDAFNSMLIGAKVELVHDNWLRSEVHNGSNLTVGILLTPSSSPPRPWDVTMAAVETLSLLSDEQRALRIDITS